MYALQEHGDEENTMNSKTAYASMVRPVGMSATMVVETGNVLEAKSTKPTPLSTKSAGPEAVVSQNSNGRCWSHDGYRTNLLSVGWAWLPSWKKTYGRDMGRDPLRAGTDLNSQIAAYLNRL